MSKLSFKALEKRAEKAGKSLNYLCQFERINCADSNPKAKYRIQDHGYSGGVYFDNLAQVDEHLEIVLEV